MSNQHVNQPAIIPLQSHLEKENDWKLEVANTITSISKLLESLDIHDSDMLELGQKAQGMFKCRVNPHYLSKMERGNIHDPLLKQILPAGDELTSPDTFINDPVGDLDAEHSSGLLHKYHGRVLLVTTGVCAVNCRYCFRRNYPYEDATATAAQWDNAFNYIENETTIEEVILSGGDPLMLSDKRLEKLCARIGKIPHIKRIRLHSRLPIVMPQRITDNLINLLVASNKKIIMVVHANHANEIDNQTTHVVNRMKEAQFTVLNQSVLLKGINDTASTLIQLSQSLFDAGILPYYLHLLDKAKGTAHFEVSKTHAIALINEIKAELPGYMVPKLVQEVAGEPSKTTIS